MAIVFVLVALLVVAVLVTGNWYVWRRLFRDTTAGRGPRAPYRRGGHRRRVAAVLSAALVASRTEAPFTLQRVLAWPGYLWLALTLYLLLALLVGELVRPVLRKVLERRAAGAERERRSGRPRLRPSRPGIRYRRAGRPRARWRRPGSRRTVRWRAVRWRAVRPPSGSPGRGTVPPGGCSSPVSSAGPPPRPRSGPSGTGPTASCAGRRSSGSPCRSPSCPRAAHGYRIAVVSDIHLGPVLGRGFAQKVVDTINSTQPDLIAVVGDLVDGSVKDLGPAAAPLAQLTARHGSFFVTGNHEYFSGAEQWVEEVRRLGLHPLENARTELPHFDLAGVNDVAGEDEGRGRTSPVRSVTGTGRGRVCCWRTSRCRFMTPSTMVWIFSCRVTRTGGAVAGGI
ncbi:hypothetical protein STENM223S_07562 [Streptomyces tendae]